MNAVQFFTQSNLKQSSFATDLQKSNESTPFLQVMNRELATNSINQQHANLEEKPAVTNEVALAETQAMSEEDLKQLYLLEAEVMKVDKTNQFLGEVDIIEEVEIVEEVDSLGEVEEVLFDETMIHGFITEIEQLIEAYRRGENERDILNRLYELLNKFTVLKLQTNDTSQGKTDQSFTTITSLLKEPHQSIWQEVVKVYEKRSKLVSQQVYQSEAMITKADVARWLEQAITKYYSEEDLTSKPQVAHVQATHQQPLQMNEVQQYTIHVNNLSRVDAISDELAQKLTNVVKNSNFLARPGMMELSITLKPENLGNIVVRFVQVNGEMTVNLLVASQLTKELLESNLHQLKPLFAPHQITIERDPVIRDGTPNSEQNDEQQDETSKQHDERNKEHNQSFENKENATAPFKEMLNLLSKEAFSG